MRLRRVLLDAYARRHEGQKIYLRQAAANRWIERREQILGGHRPNSGNSSALRANDQQLRAVSAVRCRPPTRPGLSLLLSFPFYFWSLSYRRAKAKNANPAAQLGALNHHGREHLR